MEIGGKKIRVGAERDAEEATRRGYDIASDIAKPTLNQRCYRCGEHHGWVCVCTREEKLEWWTANYKRLRREPPGRDPV